MHTFGYKNKRYSIDMMHDFININKPYYEKIDVINFEKSFVNKGWRDENGIMYSPIDVLEDPIKYKDKIKEILNINLDYPIIIMDDIVIDGMHRLVKALLLKIEYIKAYKFSYEDLEKFNIKNIYDKKYNIYKEKYNKNNYYEILSLILLIYSIILHLIKNY